MNKYQKSIYIYIYINIYIYIYIHIYFFFSKTETIYKIRTKTDDGIFVYELFDKRDKFPFLIVRIEYFIVLSKQYS